MEVSYTGKRLFYKLSNVPPSMQKVIRYKVPQADRLEAGEDSWFVKDKYVALIVNEAIKAGVQCNLKYITPDVKKAIKEVITLQPEDPYAILHLRKGAPDYVVTAVWKAFVKHNHPDVGGDPDTFLRAKQAYESICNDSRAS